MIIMSVDLGLSRTGIAVCDKMEILASPVTVIHEKDLDVTLEKTASEAQRLNPDLIVVGLPRRTDDKQGDAELRAKDFGARLGERTGKEIVMWDERFTTVSAHNYLNENNVRGKKRKNVVDAVAAVIILENYLEHRRINRTQ
ncbi:MAG: Holliday junction resolvase RuvX [Oscillospiraceae bacterium]|nr:Holliday junction resolvase RuvX [Oscillospiraceae bacterium]